MTEDTAIFGRPKRPVLTILCVFVLKYGFSGKQMPLLSLLSMIISAGVIFEFIIGFERLLIFAVKRKGQPVSVT